MKRMLLIVNPNAGKGGYRAILGDVMQILCAGGWTPTVFFSQAAGQTPELVEKHAPSFDMTVCLGGDGTLSEVAAGMLRSGANKPIGYIPLGTTNDVAKTLGISFKPIEAAKRILTGSTFPYDIGQFGKDSFFTYVAAFGAFTEVSYQTPTEAKHALGHLAYMLEGLRGLGRITDYHAAIEYDGGVTEGDFIFGAVTNSTSVAGLVKLDDRTVDLSDGRFEILLVRKPRDLLELSDIVSSALSADFNGPGVLFLKSATIRFKFDTHVSWTRDGEDGGAHREVLIQNRHPGVEIIV